MDVRRKVGLGKLPKDHEQWECREASLCFKNQARWHTPLVLALRRLGQATLQPEASLSYTGEPYKRTGLHRPICWCVPYFLAVADIPLD